ncbi:MAG: lipid A biosynthesis acyltransferase [Ferruginibacter sp.]|jgi:KDO2-lipid IV(A) lauroyltransferase
MYYLLYGILYLISLLPFFILYGISDFACFILYNVAGYRKQVVMGNLDIAFPEKTLQEKKKIAKRFYRNLTDSFVETIKLLSISEKSFLKRVDMNLDETIAMIGRGKNIQFHCGHQFGWEYGNWFVAKKLPIPFIGVYMRIKNKALDKIFYDLRSKPGTILVAAHEFKNRMHQLFTEQYSIGLAADQHPGVPGYAYWLNFFNRPTPFVTGPDKSAVKNNTAVVFVKLVKKKRGVYDFVCSVVAENAGSLENGAITLLYRDFLEKTIRENPDNYLWSHRRWKTAYEQGFEWRWIDNCPAPVIQAS